ncbi:XdhC family protein, partial [Streptomyces spectabilis]|uniref:XdhC family protein n=1 Tax=Streptomyces spectabilis TaxID=68270 RepID=UPI0033FA2624
MLDLADELRPLTDGGRAFAVATVVAVGGSAPRGPGAALAVDSEGTAVGSAMKDFKSDQEVRWCPGCGD